MSTYDACRGLELGEKHAKQKTTFSSVSFASGAGQAKEAATACSRPNGENTGIVEVHHRRF
jgi:hypothetical protein